MENKPKFHPNPKLKLMDQGREVLRHHHYAYRTEQTYGVSCWSAAFVTFILELSAKEKLFCLCPTK